MNMMSSFWLFHIKKIGGFIWNPNSSFTKTQHRKWNGNFEHNKTTALNTSVVAFCLALEMFPVWHYACC